VFWAVFVHKEIITNDKEKKKHHSIIIKNERISPSLSISIVEKKKDVTSSARVFLPAREDKELLQLIFYYVYDHPYDYLMMMMMMMM